MSLQLALLLIGIVIIVVVALSVLDHGRMSRFLRRAGHGARRVPPDRIAPIVTVPPAAGPDHHPALVTVADNKVLRSDAPVAPPPVSPDREFRRKLEALEEVASMPLDLDDGVKRRRAKRIARPAAPDEHIDFIMFVPGDQPVSRDTALGVYKQYEYRIDKPHRLYGMNDDVGLWTELQQDAPDASYRDLSLAIQLVDTSGPADESALNAFMQVGLKLADALHRPTRFSHSFEDALERARRLQQFCDTYDVIAALNVAATDSRVFRGRDVESAARRLGLQFGAMNIFHMESAATPGGPHLFSMANMIQPGDFKAEEWDTLVTPGVTFFLSVPCTHRPAQIFEHMAEIAASLAEALDGQLLDQDRRPLTDQGLAVIRHQIEEIEEKMRAFGVTPGSEAARRLFGPAAGIAEDTHAPAHA
jgi:cell division protein ZipA